MKDLLTIEEAAILVGRTKRTIYNWIDGGRLRTRTDPNDGTYRVRPSDVTRAETEVKRGRPRGSGKLR